MSDINAVPENIKDGQQNINAVPENTNEHGQQNINTIPAINTVPINEERRQKPVTIEKQRGKKPHEIKQFFVPVGAAGTSSKRKNQACKFCDPEKQTPLKEPKLPTLCNHLQQCESATQEAKDMANRIKTEISVKKEPVPKEAKANQPPKSKKRSAPAAGHVLLTGNGSVPAAGGFSPDAQIEQNLLLLRWLIREGIPFEAVEDPFFLEYVRLASGGKAQSADALSLQTHYLPLEISRIRTQTLEMLANSRNLTLHIDKFTSTEKGPWYATSVTTHNGDVHLLSMDNLPLETMTTENLRDFIFGNAKAVGLERISAITTDSTPTLKNARNSLVELPGCSHMISFTCMMEGYGALLGSMFGHPEAQEIINNAQKLACFVKSSPQLCALLNESSKGTVPFTLITPSTECLTSVHKCIASANECRQALRTCVNRSNNLASNPFNGHPELANLAQNAHFFGKINALVHVTECICKVISAVREGKRLTTAEHARYWIYIGRALARCIQTSEIGGVFTQEYKKHIVDVYTRQVDKLDMKLCKLALFLDPRFRSAAVGTSSEDGLKSIIHTAVEIMKNRRFRNSDLNQLIRQMHAYRTGQAPFNSVCTSFDNRVWWMSIGGVKEDREMIVNLAIVVQEIAPHTANRDQLFGEFLTAKKSASGSVNGAPALRNIGCMMELARQFYALNRPDMNMHGEGALNVKKPKTGETSGLHLHEGGGSSGMHNIGSPYKRTNVCVAESGSVSDQSSVGHILTALQNMYVYELQSSTHVLMNLSETRSTESVWISAGIDIHDQNLDPFHVGVIPVFTGLGNRARDDEEDVELML